MINRQKSPLVTIYPCASVGKGLFFLSRFLAKIALPPPKKKLHKLASNNWKRRDTLQNLRKSVFFEQALIHPKYF